jgi:superfamily II DNA helicase RecQ
MAMGKLGNALRIAFPVRMRLQAFTATLRLTEEKGLMKALGVADPSEWHIERDDIDRPNISLALRLHPSKKHWAGNSSSP